jgi:membrane associated rhomboid family serine protease
MIALKAFLSPENRERRIRVLLRIAVYSFGMWLFCLGMIVIGEYQPGVVRFGAWLAFVGGAFVGAACFSLVKHG